MPPKKKAGADTLTAALTDLNKEFFVVEEGGKHLVAFEWWDPERMRRTLKRFTFAEFKRRFLSVQFPAGSRIVTLGDAWMRWPQRRQYLGGIVFAPDPVDLPPDVYNLWRGWAVPPSFGDWSILREHVRTVLCAGNEQHFNYVLGWLARLVQSPAAPGEVVLVFRGEQGAGKTLATEAFKRMLGAHALSVSSPRGVTGQFNSHLRDLVLLVANEAVFAGDRAARDVLKALVTDSNLFIEQKGIDPMEVRNHLHVIMTTNASWAVPVGLRDRRFAVFDVASSNVGDRDYFRRLAMAVQEDAVIAAMLHDLLNVNLDDFQVRDIPATAARHEQMVQSLEGDQAWLHHVLALGALEVEGPPEWPEWASTRELQKSHEVWARGGRHRAVTDPATLGRFLARFFPSKRPRVNNGPRERGYSLGTLEQARARFCEVTGLPAATAFPNDETGPRCEDEDGPEGAVA